MGFIVEVTSRSGRVIERHRINGPVATLGRAFDNDVIISDPYVDAHHAVIEETERGNQIRATRAGIPLWSGRKTIDETPAALASGDAVSLGRTHLRIYALDHPVASVLSFDRIEQLFSSMTAPSRLVLGLAGFVALIALDTYLRSYQTMEFSRLAQELISYLTMTLAWAAGWAVVARISRGEPRFLHHWLVALIAVSLNQVGEFLLEVVAFNTGSLTAVQIMRYLIGGACLAFALTMNLRFALRQTPVVRHAYAQGFAWLIIGYSVLTSWSFDNLFLLYPEFDATVLPETFRIAPTVSVEDFGARTDSLYSFTADELN